MEVTQKRWMHGRSKESHLFPLTHSVKWIEAEPFDLAFTLPFFPPPTESTLLLQLLQTEKVMGLRFCPDKGVRTLSLLLTPLSHQWDQGGRGRGHRGLVNHSLPPSSCLNPSASELSLAPLYVIMGCCWSVPSNLPFIFLSTKTGFQRGPFEDKAFEDCLSSQAALVSGSQVAHAISSSHHLANGVRINQHQTIALRNCVQHHINVCVWAASGTFSTSVKHSVKSY